MRTRKNLKTLKNHMERISVRVKVRMSKIMYSHNSKRTYVCNVCELPNTAYVYFF